MPARDAATLILVRDADGLSEMSLEVCMVRRHLDSEFVGGAYVFPGGKVDVHDRSTAAGHACAGRDDAQASELLGVDSGGLAFWVAALRECFEEAGVLLAYQDGPDAHGELIDMTLPLARQRLALLRHRLNAGEISFLDLLRGERLQLAADRVLYFSHWVTPVGAPRRYDTRFFVAAVPNGQVPVHDEHETVDTVWVRPADALARAAVGELDIIFPTMKNLQAVGRFGTAAELLGAVAAVDHVPTVLPRVVADAHGFRILLPGDAGYDAALPSGTTVSSQSLGSAQVAEAVRSIDIHGRSRRR
ncbi:MAG TPA: hypothetical protein VK386_06190 [Acidimicrobiales bacterium]|nr:hypothetical protein [Acidimicrobiales bacterium]